MVAEQQRCVAPPSSGRLTRKAHRRQGLIYKTLVLRVDLLRDVAKRRVLEMDLTVPFDGLTALNLSDKDFTCVHFGLALRFRLAIDVRAVPLRFRIMIHASLFAHDVEFQPKHVRPFKDCAIVFVHLLQYHKALPLGHCLRELVTGLWAEDVILGKHHQKGL